MPASPGMKCSPGREPRGDKHKRVHSLESGISFKERDDDLALFNEVQTRERDEFLLQANDDFEDTFVSKLRHFSDHKVGISVASRGESSDFLNAEEEKNDYEWLITPPDTPLFASLDDESPQVTIAQRGRPRAQPISISRSSTMEKSHRSSRGSPSPNRLSPSPHSSEPTFQQRSRPSSLPSSSPPPTRRPITRSKRPSSPSSKHSTPPPRASTPTSRRLSTGSVSTCTGARGISGNSVSPKVRAWQANIPGFSTEAPPNLRTSLADRPASYVRGSSPASKNGRHSMSPIATRSISSSHSHDRDRFNSYSKGSIASSADNDVESLRSVTVDGSERSNSRKVSGYRNNNKAPFSQKPSRTVSSNAAPKRSFDLALRQMDHRKGQQNMFRPLLTSVPTSNYYAGKASPAWNSSVTTSSNASSDVNTSGPHDIEGNEPNDDEYDDATSGHIKVPDCNIEDDEVFVFEKSVSVNEDGFENLAQHDTATSIVLDDEDDDDDDDATSRYVKVPDCNIEDDAVFLFEKSSSLNEEMGNQDGFENHTQHDTATSVVLDDFSGQDDFMEVDSLKDTLLCSRCGLRYSDSGQTDDDIKLCQYCRKSALSLSNSQEKSTMSDKDQESVNTVKPQRPVVIDESVELTFKGETQSEQQKDLVEDSEITNTEQSQHTTELTQVNLEVISQLNSSYSDAGSEPFQHSNDFPKSKVNSLLGDGISVVLKRSSSIKRPLIQSGNFSASSISYDDLSFAKGSTNSMRSSIGRGSMSTSSSVDFGPRFHRQLSSRKSDIENYKTDLNVKHRRSVSSLSVGTSTLDSSEVSIVRVETDVPDTTSVGLHENTSENKTCIDNVVDNASFQNIEDLVKDTSALTSCTLEKVDDVENDTSDVSSCIFEKVEDLEKDTSTLTKCTFEIVENSEKDTSATCTFEKIDDSENDTSVLTTCTFEKTEDLENDTSVTCTFEKAEDVGKDTSALSTCTFDEDTCLNPSVEIADVTEVQLDAILEKEPDQACLSSPDSQSNVSVCSESNVEESQDPTARNALGKDIAASSTDFDTTNHSSSIIEESVVLVEGERGTKGRSLTLAEATDTILFCSSIIHNLAYEAATLAIEKEPVPETNDFFPLVPATGKDNSATKEISNKKTSKRSSKSQKKRSKKTEEKDSTKAAPKNTHTGEETDSPKPRIVYPNPNNKENTMPPKLESKCNCRIM